MEGIPRYTHTPPSFSPGSKVRGKQQSTHTTVTFLAVPVHTRVVYIHTWRPCEGRRRRQGNLLFVSCFIRDTDGTSGDSPALTVYKEQINRTLCLKEKHLAPFPIVRCTAGGLGQIILKGVGGCMAGGQGTLEQLPINILFLSFFLSCFLSAFFLFFFLSFFLSFSRRGGGR